MRRIIKIALVLWLAGRTTGHAQIRTDEEVLFFPTAARLNDTGDAWLAPIHGWIFEPERNSFTRRTILRQLADELHLEDDADKTGILTERAGWLMVDNERGKRIEIAIGDQQFTLPPSAEDGHVEKVLELPADFVAGVAENGRIPFHAVLPEGDDRRFAGAIEMVNATGLTVISDVDDTVKVSEVVDRQRLLQRTFLEPFEVVAGAAPQYQAWHNAGALIWFVSASPWQLYSPLEAFLTDSGFPAAQWRMKRVRLLDPSVRQLFADPYDYKLKEIAAIIQAFPQRHYALIGDSGEQDPETYGEIARRFPEQVVIIAIRDVTDQTADAERYLDAFDEVPADRWLIFHDPAEVELPVGE